MGVRFIELNSTMKMAASLKFTLIFSTINVAFSTNFGCEWDGVPASVKVRCLNPKGEQFFLDLEESALSIFCYAGQSKAWSKLWTKAMAQYQISTEYYRMFVGNNASSVYQQYDYGSRSYLWYLPWKSNSIQFEPFKQSCVGLTIDIHQATLHLNFQVRRVDVIYVLLCIFGIALYFSADKLSRNILFYYGTGISVGVLASLVILAIVLSRFVPKKGGLFALVGFSMTISFWLIQYLWNHLEKLLSDYWKYVAGYMVIAGLVSFAVCYRRGPVTDHRTLNLIKWSIKMLSLLLIYNGSAIPHASIAIIALVIVYDNTPSVVGRSLKSYWRRKFPEKRKLISQEEYFKQGQEETRKALEELRGFCRSPQCDAWKTISRLRTPSRFASFIEGDSHISDEEIMDYDSDPNPPITRDMFTDDEDEMDFRLNSL